MGAGTDVSLTLKGPKTGRRGGSATRHPTLPTPGKAGALELTPRRPPRVLRTDHLRIAGIARDRRDREPSTQQSALSPKPKTYRGPLRSGVEESPLAEALAIGRLSPDCRSKAGAAALVLHDDLLQVGLQLWIDRQSAFEIAHEERGLLLHPGAGVCGPESFRGSELH